MGDCMEATLSSELLDLDIISSRLRKLTDIQTIYNEDLSEIPPSESENLLRDCALHLENKVEQIMSELSDVSLLGIQDLDTLTEHLKEELSATEAESAKICDQIEALTNTHVKDCSQLESDLEALKYSLDFIKSQSLEKVKDDAHVISSTEGEDQLDLISIHRDQRFEILDLENQFEKSKNILRSLEDLDFEIKRVGAIGQIEDALTGLKVIDFDGTSIRLSLQTYLPKTEFLSQQSVEDISEPFDVNHELLLEILDGTMDIKTVEIFPNDVYIGDIVDAAKSFRQLFCPLVALETRSSLAWFMRKVQDRIILCTLRQLVVKSANKSRHSFEYLDRDETIVAHLVVGVDAFIKVSQGWPLSDSALKLVSLKSTNHHSKDVSLSFPCKVEEAANSLDVQMWHSLSSFVDALEKVLVEQKHLENHSDDNLRV
ncbi:hypothetical protein HS088_TW13G01279 [Tripterygium wilfordii]|uniref:Uncharacterized protein n=1 Tax=Tripterygium wilfordii TaxID=458696 RepID=A0A7J7CWB7_TRIWF|nr:uncharacterized protein LOC120011898 [Tripterygium wilfordii]XP_038718993.1 uncharacterized protein LOC120011898 [Tripterygium wilfordii]XP_038718994.1 uncharacterized protein LOC120011898 [Tripterygium wilfordii]KAF5738380.1 hypothetical protein HS088_TW13G01279 [Tripterygium wilfordii]